MPLISVTTGDLISSTKVAEPDAFRRCLRDILQLLEDRYHAQGHIFRGDGFQVITGSKVNALRLAVLLRTGLISRSMDRENRWDARIAIAYGPEQPAGTDQNSQVHVNSGRLLDSMDKDHLLLHARNDNMRLATAAATAFADDIINRLTPTEAEVLFHHLLDESSHQQIADKLGKQRPTITLALQRARYHLMDGYIRDMDSLLRMGGL